MDYFLERKYNKAFIDSPQVVLIDVISVKDQEDIKITFESKNSEWKQGVWISCDNGVEIAGQHMSSAVLWYETAPKQIAIRCFANNGLLALYNVWDRGLGMNSQSHSSGMVIEEIPFGWRYNCNDIGFETDFKRLVFKLELKKY